MLRKDLVIDDKQMQMIMRMISTQADREAVESFKLGGRAVHPGPDRASEART